MEDFFKEKTDDILTSVFKTTEQGMYNIDFPISDEGRFEIVMFDIWLGMMLIEAKNIDIDYGLTQDRIEEYLKQIASKLGLPAEKKHERIYLFRKEDWERDLLGLINLGQPDNLRAKRFLTAYMYLCMVEKPLLVFDENITEKKTREIPFDKLVKFLEPFREHYSWLIKRITNSINK